MTLHGDYNKELELCVEIGVPALGVIRSATKHGPEFMGLGDEPGTGSHLPVIPDQRRHDRIACAEPLLSQRFPWWLRVAASRP